MARITAKKIINTVKNLTPKQAINLALNEFDAMRQSTVVHSMSQIVDVVVTKRCNLRCVFCKNYETKGTEQVSLENFEKVANLLFPTARQLSICSGGEPYLHKQLVDMLKIARRFKIFTWVLSNGMMLKDTVIRTIVKEELITKHGFSVDGIKPSTVESIRINAKLEVILENIKMLIRIRKNEGKTNPKIAILYALMKSNIDELPDSVRYWGEAGIDVIECIYLSLCNEVEQGESLFFHKDRTEQIFKEARQIAAHYPHLTLNLPPAIDEEQHLQHAPRKCIAPWNFVQIDTDGRVFPCYNSWGAITMGNAYENSTQFADIWNNTIYQKLRQTVNNDSSDKCYSYCSICQIRYGEGNLTAHFGDKVWLEQLNLKPEEREQVLSHRRRGRKNI